MLYTAQLLHYHVHIESGYTVAFFPMQIDQQRQDRRLHHPHTMSEITKYMDAAWRQKEQESMQQ